MKTIEGIHPVFCCAAGRVFALKGRNNIAQGLGPGFVDRPPDSALKGRDKEAVGALSRPSRAESGGWALPQGRGPGL